ncbi:glutathione S-transferase family protein [Bradyrhizobium sp. Arg237L]|uniref:glutathione S-transferase family protein n=1 Tax=Bradyrhizobium sp. Arg237L TaxID=3003352 RepID=UPI00249DC25F|nr:glutathione S-transferase family protein [Bradyrhizobium sp. Arg237L]MDI4236536.1 glutathione S-transferase family protein [Bradyrhizobium sp. Arg237L]
MEFELYCRAESGNCYKVALMLSLCNLSWRPRFVDFFNDASRAEFRAKVSGMGELPVLKANNLTLSQSGVILTYLSEATGLFGGKTDEERREILRWILFDNHRFTPSYATLRFVRGLRGLPESAVTEWLRGQAIIALEIVEERLKDRPFVVGDDLTIADISMCAYQFYHEETGIDRSQYPHIGAWLDRIASYPGWAHPYELMPRALASAAREGAAGRDDEP